MNGPLLTVRGLDVRYGEARALFGVDLDVGHGEAVAVLGANGAGKSSLSAAIAGTVPVAGGSVHFDGHDVTGWGSHRMSRAGLVYVPEGRGIFPNLSVLDNLRAMLRWSVPPIGALGRWSRSSRRSRSWPIVDVGPRRHPVGG